MRRLGTILGLALVLASVFPQRAAADSIVRTWEVGEEPFGIAIDPTDGRVFVANSKYPSTGELGPGSITVIDPRSNQYGALVTSGPADLVALDPLHRRLYSSNLDHSLQVFDLDNLGLIARLPVGGLGVAADPQTQRVYVLDQAFSRSFLTVVDGATNTVVQTKYAPTTEIWWGLALDAGRHRLYVTNSGTDPYVPPTGPSLVVLDDRDLSLIADVSLPLLPRFALAIDEIRDRVYVGAYDGTGNFANSMFYALDGATLTVLASTPIPGFPAGIAVAPEAHRVYVTSPDNGSGGATGYRALDDQTYEVVQTVSTAPYSAYMPVLHPDGDLYLGVWLRFGSDALMRVHVGNSAPVITSVGFAPAAPTTNDVLQALVSATDNDLPDLTGSRAALTYTYTWSRNGVVIPGETGSTLDLSRVGDRGDTITLRVSATDGELTATATASVVVANTPLSGLVVGLSDPTPQSHDVLVATAACEDADNDATFTYTWSVNGIVRQVTSTSTVDSFDLGPKGNGDNGDVVTVAVVASDGASTTATATASATVTPGRRK